MGGEGLDGRNCGGCGVVCGAVCGVVCGRDGVRGEWWSAQQPAHWRPVFSLSGCSFVETEPTLVPAGNGAGTR